mgnify:CR=1 FL=1
MNQKKSAEENRQIIGLFGVPMFEKDFVYKEKNDLIEFAKKQGGRKVSNIGGFQSNDFIRSQNPIKDKFLNELSKHMGEAVQAYGPGKFKLICTAIWVNINYPQSWNITHIHPQTDFTSTVYFDVPLDSGDLIIESVDNVRNYQRFYCIPLNIDSIFTRLKYVHTPKENSLIILPGHLPHSVSVNNSNKERISVSANFSVERESETQTNNS